MQSAYSPPLYEPEDIEQLWAESARLVDDCTRAAADEGAVITMICRAARNLAKADGACVILREGELVHYARECTVAPLWAGQRFPIGNCISGWSILHRERVVIEDIYEDARIPVEYYRSTFVKSLAMQPIEPRNPIGAIGVYWSRKHRANERELELLEKLASVAAVLLENARLRGLARASREDPPREAATKDEFLAVVSHELRSPLAAILGWTRLLRRAGSDHAVLTRAAGVIERSAETQARLIDDLVDISRITTGKLHLRRRPIDIERLLREAIDAAQPAADARGTTIDLHLHGPVGDATADRERLWQVIGNLLTNAIKFTPPGGHVAVSAERSGCELSISVTDDGVGIERELLPHVFDRYRQGRVADQQGLGLGLAIAREIVNLHGGTIEAHSDGLGRGARFTVRLPLTA